MPLLEYMYESALCNAQVQPHYAGAGIRTYVATLSNGRQAFLKYSFGTGNWAQEPFTEHEDWPADLIIALGTAIKLNFA